MFNTFIFDFDLTLCDSSKGILICFKHTLNQFGYEIPDDRTIYNTIGLTVEQAFTVLCGVTDEEKIKEMKICYVKKADEVMAINTVFYENALESLEKLRSRGYKVGIVSTKYRYRIVETFEKQCVNMPVDVIIGGEDVLVHKPDPSGLLAMIEKLGAEKENVLYVGDSYIDAQTAMNAGVNFGGVTTGITTLEEFDSYDYYKISDSIFNLINSVLGD
ncbi:MAG: HAD family hydrolase [Ruminococcus sp.]|nr:HAD family hydrolase [Ruminococcus sp.]